MMDTTQYFYRNAMLSKKGNELSLIDIFNPDQKGEVLEPWFGAVLQLADGQHTIDALYQFVSGTYKGAPPVGLQDTLQSVISRLVKLKLIVLSKEPTDLPYYLSLPIEQLDIDKAKRLLAEDKVNLNQN